MFGPSGAGKTSIVNMVAGLSRPEVGRILINDRCLFDSAGGINVPPEKRRVGYVFQDARRFPHLSVRTNLAYGMRLVNHLVLLENGRIVAAGRPAELIPGLEPKQLD